MKIPKIPPKLRQEIYERDGGCVLRDENCNFGLHIHHIRFGRLEREYGSENEPYNLATLCGYHHNLGGPNCVHQNKELNEKVKEIIKKHERYNSID